MLRGSINHVSVTVSDVPEAMKFFRPFLEFLGYIVPPGDEDQVIVSVSPRTGGAFNVWPATDELKGRPFEIYAPGLHHVAFNAESRGQVDEMHELVQTIGGEILEAPAEWPFTSVGKYYAVYFRGPDGMKFEYVHMDSLEELHRKAGLLGENLWQYEGV